MTQSEDLQRSHLGNVFETAACDEFADIQFERFEFCETHQLFDPEISDGAGRKREMSELACKTVNKMFQSDVCEMETSRANDRRKVWKILLTQHETRTVIHFSDL